MNEVELLGMRLVRVRTGALLDHLFDALERGEGGWIVTANLDILRRSVVDARSREVYGAADLRVADGMPLVWASRVLGTPLPERVAGSTMTEVLAARAAAEGRSLYLLGGDPGAAEGCTAVLGERHPAIRILGHSSPWVSNPATDEEIEETVREMREQTEEDPDIILVGLGSPKQEHVIRKLRAHYPKAWFMGIGITFSFIAGQVQRAPEWMHDIGLEWVHRMVQDPKRLVRRYLIDDLPFALLLFGDALRRRVRT